jgi:hypothetical protein
MTHRTFSIIAPFGGIALILLLFWLDRRWRMWRSGWRFKKEIVEPLGEVTASYEHGKLVRYHFKKHGVLLQIMCADPEARTAGIELACSVSKQDLDRHLQEAVKCIPDSDSKAFGFDKGSYTLQTVIIHNKDSMSFELANSADRDHVALVILQNGRYTFEAVDG